MSCGRPPSKGRIQPAFHQQLSPSQNLYCHNDYTDKNISPFKTRDTLYTQFSYLLSTTTPLRQIEVEILFCHRQPFDTAFTRPNGIASHQFCFIFRVFEPHPKNYRRPLVCSHKAHPLPARHQHTVSYLYPAATTARQSLKNQMFLFKARYSYYCNSLRLAKKITWGWEVSVAYSLFSDWLGLAAWLGGDLLRMLMK